MRLGIHYCGGSVDPHFRVWFNAASGVAFNQNHVGRIFNTMKFWNLASNPYSTYDKATQRSGCYCNRIHVVKCATHNEAEYDLSGMITLAPRKYSGGGAIPTGARPYMAPLRPDVTPESGEFGWDLTAGSGIWNSYLNSRTTESDIVWTTGSSSTHTIDIARLYDAFIAVTPNFYTYIPAGVPHDLLIFASQWALWNKKAPFGSGAGKIQDGNTLLLAYAYLYAPVDACAV